MDRKTYWRDAGTTPTTPSPSLNRLQGTVRCAVAGRGADDRPKQWRDHSAVGEDEHGLAC